MKEDPKVKKAYHFLGISVLVPMQTEQDSEIVALDWRNRIPDDIPEKTDNFSLIRYIANIVLFRKDHLDREYYEEPIQEFNPPIEFRVHYRFDDVNSTDCDIQQLKLAYWDGQKWVIISDPTHEYHILPPSTAQVAEAKIWSWIGDPALAWGK